MTLLWEAQDIGLATGVLGSIRGMAGAIAQALYVSILTNKATAYLTKFVPPAALNAGLPAKSLPALFEGIALGSFSDVPGITTDIEVAVGGAVVHAYTDAFHMVFYATIPFSCLLVLAAFFVPDMNKYLHFNVAKKLQGRGAKEGSHVDDEKIESH